MSSVGDLLNKFRYKKRSGSTDVKKQSCRAAETKKCAEGEVMFHTFRYIQALITSIICCVIMNV